MTHRLIVCNLPHPRGVAYERAHNKEQKINTAYAQRFRQEDAAKSLIAEGLAARVKDPKEREHYIETMAYDGLPASRRGFRDFAQRGHDKLAACRTFSEEQA